MILSTLLNLLAVTGQDQIVAINVSNPGAPSVITSFVALGDGHKPVLHISMRDPAADQSFGQFTSLDGLWIGRFGNSRYLESIAEFVHICNYRRIPFRDSRWKQSYGTRCGWDPRLYDFRGSPDVYDFGSNPSSPTLLGSYNDSTGVNDCDGGAAGCLAGGDIVRVWPYAYCMGTTGALWSLSIFRTHRISPRQKSGAQIVYGSARSRYGIVSSRFDY